MFKCIYRPPSQNKQHLSDKLPEIIDYYSSIYGNYIILGCFKMEAIDSLLNAFIKSHDLYNLIKSNTCSKRSGSCIDQILTKRKFWIYSLLKTTFKKEDSKRLIYRDYKNFNKEYVQNGFENRLSKCSKNDESFQKYW